MTNKIHLSEKQKVILERFKSDHTERPTFKQYESYQRLMKEVDPDRRTKPKRKNIPHTKLGFGATDVVLLDGFDALVDLPEGWCVFPRYDSGSNQGITSAGQYVLTETWNYWNDDWVLNRLK